MAEISTKELNYIKDFLSWELYMAKVCNDHANQVSDRNYAQLMQDTGRTHQQNFNDLLHYLESVK